MNVEKKLLKNKKVLLNVRNFVKLVKRKKKKVKYVACSKAS